MPPSVTTALAHDIKHTISLIDPALAELYAHFNVPPSAPVRTRVDAQVSAAVQMMEDLLLAARFSELGVHPAKEPVSLEALVREMLSQYEPLLKRRSVRAEFHGSGPEISGDPKLLSRVIQNLLANAVKFVLPQGSISISLSSRAGWCDLIVQDTGVGMDSAVLKTLFEPFVATSDKSLAGVGLGLSIVKSIVEAHGGLIHVQSAVGKGSTFTVSLPSI